MMKLKVLQLAIHKEAFEVMLSGEKTHEYRKPTKFIKSRLVDKKTGAPKQYDVVKFTNGYGKHRPYFVCEYKGYHTGWSDSIEFSNGLKVVIEPDDFIIVLGKIGIRKNLELLKKRV